MTSNDWKIYKMGDIVDVTQGLAINAKTKHLFREIGLPLLRISDLFSDNYLQFISEKDVPKQCIATKDEIIYTRTGQVGYVFTNKTGVVHNNCFKVTPRNNAVSREFVYWFLRQESIREYVNTIASGSVQKDLTHSAFKTIEIKIPNLHTQKRIASIFRAIDDRIALLRETSTTLEAIAQTLFKSWFVDFDPVHAKMEGREPEGIDTETAALFPDSFEESELGSVPSGWRVRKFGDFITRLSVGKKYDNKSALPEGNVPILDQGKSGIIGFHNDTPSVKASLESPIVVFANHTCYMRLISYDFSAIQNVLPFVGKDVDTVWAYYATKDRVKFSEYKGHWPDFAIEKAVVPDEVTTVAFRNTTDSLIRRMRINEQQAQTLVTLRDTLLPRLISGQLRLPDAEALIEETV